MFRLTPHRYLRHNRPNVGVSTFAHRATLMVAVLASFVAGTSYGAPLLPAEARENRERALQNSVPVATSNQVGGASVDTSLPLSEMSDEALTQLSADWPNLTAAQRRGLLTEVKRRMARQREAAASAPPRIVATRRFGRVVRNADGDVVRIETQVVRQVLNPDGSAVAAPAFGAGFDRRRPNAQPVIDSAPERPQAEAGAKTQTVAHPQR